MTEEQHESINDFIKPTIEEPNDETSIVKADASTTEIVLAPSADEIKRQRSREAYQRQKERLEALKNNQVRGSQVILFNITSKIRAIDIVTEDDYRKLIEDLLGTLKDNQLLSDYLVQPRL